MPRDISALEGNRAALTLLLVQSAGGAVLMGVLDIGMVPALALTVAVNAALLLTVFRRPFAALRASERWRTLPPVWTTLGAFALAFVASRAWAAAAITLWPNLVVADTAELLLTSSAGPWALLLLAGVAIPVMEEIGFRGLLMRGHERAAGYLTAALTTTLAFSLAHGAPASVVGILPLAYALARAVQHTRSLWSGVAIHVLNNSLSLALGLFLVGSNPELFDMAGAGSGLEDLPQQMRVLAGLASFGFGAGLIMVLHFWLTPQRGGADMPQRGPWLSGAYVVIVVFGLLQLLLTFPAISELFSGVFSSATPAPAVP